MTSSSSLYGSVTTQNTSSTNSTSLYGEAGTPIPDSNGNVVVRGDLYVLSGNILTTATTGNIFPTNATTINLGLAATAVNIGAGTGTTTINNNLQVNGTFVAPGADFGNITIGVATDNTITTTTGDLDITATGNNGVNITSGNDAPTLITRTTNNTNTGTRSLALSVQSTGTPAVGFGNSLEWQVETAPGNTENAGFVSVTSTDITPGSEDFRMNFGLMTNGALSDTKMFLDSTGKLTVSSDLQVNGANINIAPSTNFLYSENNDRANRPEFQSTTGNSSGLRVRAPNTGTSASSTFSVNNSSDSANTEFLSLQARGSALGDTFRFLTGKFIANVQSASNKSISFTDNTNTYATVNPAGPTIPTDLTTKAYVDAIVIDNTTYTINASTVTGGANFNLVGTDLTTDTIKYSSGTGVTVSRTDANTIDFAIGQAVATTSNVTFADVIVGDDLTVQGNNVNLAQATTIGYSENGSRVNRPQIQSTTGNTSGLRVLAPNATTSASSVFVTIGSNDIDNGSFMAVRTSGSTTAPFAIATGKYTGGVLSASGLSVNFIDNATTYASVNPAGPTNSTDLTTKSYVDGLIPVVPTYDTNVAPVAGGAELDLRQIIGAGISIVGSTQFIGGTNVTVSETSPNVITISAPDTNTTYDFNATSTTGGANLNLVGSDATTDTVKLTNGGGITATYTSGTEVTLGSTATSANTASAIVARDASGNFSAGTITASLSGNATTATTATQVANSLTAGTYLSGGPFNGSAPVTLSTNATSANTASTLVARDASGNFSAGTITANLADQSRVLGQLIATPVLAYTPVGSALTTITGINGLAISSSTGGANGNAAQVAIRYHSGDTGAGANSASAVVTSGASGTSTAPGGVTTNQVLGAYNFDGYTAGTSNNYAAQIATANQGAGTTALAPLQAQGYARQAFTNSTTVTTAVTGASGTGSVATLTFTLQNTAPYIIGQTVTIAGMTPSGYNGTVVLTGVTTSSISYANATTGFTTGGTIAAVNTVTAAGTGFRIRGYANSTNMTAQNRFNFMDLTASAATFKANTYTFANEVITGSTLTQTNYLSITGTSSTFASSAGTYATLNSTNALFGIPGGANYASISGGGNTFTNTGISSFVRQGTTNTTQPALLVRYSRTDTTGSNDGDGVDFRLGTGGTSTTDNIARFDAQYRTSGFHQVGISVSTDSFAADTDTVYRAQADKTVIRVTPTGTTTSATDMLTVESTKITAGSPLAFPRYTTTQRDALTPAQGWVLFNTTTVKLQCYDGANWQDLF